MADDSTKVFLSAEVVSGGEDDEYGIGVADGEDGIGVAEAEGDDDRGRRRLGFKGEDNTGDEEDDDDDDDVEGGLRGRRFDVVCPNNWEELLDNPTTGTRLKGLFPWTGREGPTTTWSRLATPSLFRRNGRSEKVWAKWGGGSSAPRSGALLGVPLKYLGCPGRPRKPWSVSGSIPRRSWTAGADGVSVE
jgi:hypothetical protein